MELVIWPLSRAPRLSISCILKGGYGFPRKEKGNMMKKFCYFILLKENKNLVKKRIFFKDSFLENVFLII